MLIMEDIVYGKKESGRTTRLVDNAIQRYFKLEKGRKMFIQDHSNTKEGQSKLIEKFIKRMSIEHPNEIFNVNKINNTIERL